MSTLPAQQKAEPVTVSGTAINTDSNVLQNIWELLVVTICTLAFIVSAFGIGLNLVMSTNVGSRDFITYWSAGQQLTHHNNPYDGNEIERIEKSAGFPAHAAVMLMRNPPLAIPLVYPLGSFSAKLAARIWSALLLFCLVASVRMVWEIHGRPKTHMNILGYAFSAALSCLSAGQMSLIVLLGLALFLRFHRAYPVIAGASLLLMALKPHLFLPFFLTLALWCIASRQFRLMVGAAGGLLMCLAIAYVFDPAGWSQYLWMMAQVHLDTQPIPGLSLLLLRLHPTSEWLRYAAGMLGCVWAGLCFYQHRSEWDWLEHGSTVLLVSVVVAPYAWFTDQSVLIPALLSALYHTRSRSTVAILALLSAAIEVAVFRGAPLIYLGVWIAPAWLFWYLWAARPLIKLDEREADVITL